MPDGLDDTPPEPTCVTASANCWTNVAVTDALSVIATVHVLAFPEHPPPLHEETTHPDAGVAVSTTF